MSKLCVWFGLIFAILAICVALSDAQQQRQRQQQQQQQVVRRQQRPRPAPVKGQGQGHEAANGNGAHKKRKQRPQKPVKPYKFFTKTIPDLGRLRGRIVKTEWTGKNILQFLDIPYGKSPVGPLRFKPSVLAEPWQGVLPSHYYHPGCPSIQNLDKFEILLENNFDIEDCLRLSISTKSLKGSAPVMVYIHGDFFYDGDTVEAAPGYLLEEDIVLVSVRYRLGPLGFLSTMSEDIPGNAAVHDIILSLKWVQKHIAAFGGDPKRVTLFGQVGGAALINVLTLSPLVLPDALFHRVIYQSGSTLAPSFITDAPISATKDIARIAGCKNVNKIEALNKCMRRLNATALLDAFNTHGDNRVSTGIGSYGGVQLVIGGPSGVLPEHPGKLLAADKFSAYPTMGGSVKHAGTFILKDIFIDSFNDTIIDESMSGMEYIEHIIEQTNGADPTGAWKKYASEEIFTANDIKNGTFKRLTPGLIDMCSTIPFKNPVLLVMQANAKKLPNSTYLYSFDYEGELNRYSSPEEEQYEAPFDFGVSLTDDNLYLFPWPRFSTLNSNRDIKMARRMVELWTSFARTGVPKAANVPDWPAMSDETGPYMKIDRSVTFGDNYLDEYNVAVRETKSGYNLVNENFYDELKLDKEYENSFTHEDIDNEEMEDADESTASEGRGTNLVFIARKSNRKS